MRRVLPALLLALAAATAAEPDSLGWVTGRVTDKASGKPLVGVEIYGLPILSHWGDITRENGEYLMKAPTGRQRMMPFYWYRALDDLYVVSASDTVPVDVIAGDTVVADIALDPDPHGPVKAAVRRMTETLYRGIRPILDTMDWDVTLAYTRQDGLLMRARNPTLADSARVRALRVWEARSGSYRVRIIATDPESGDTAITSYLLVEDGRCTVILQRRQYARHLVVSPWYGEIVVWHSSIACYDTGGWWAPYGASQHLLRTGNRDRRPPDYRGRLRLRLQVDGWSRRDPLVF